MGQWSYEQIDLPLKYDWSIARGKSNSRVNLKIAYKSDGLEGLGEVAFVTGGEFQLEDAVLELDDFVQLVPRAINGLEHMMECIHSLDLHSSVKAGLEVAYISYLAQVLQGPIEKVLAVDVINKYPTSYSLPLLKVDDYENFLKDHNLKRFKSLKLKVDGLKSRDIVNKLIDLYQGKIWLDGNESFKTFEELDTFCKEIDMSRIEIFEQPFLRSDYQSQKLAKLNIGDVLWFADESLQSGVIGSNFVDLFHGVNIKLMKSGGLFSALRQVREAKSYKLKVMLGCMLETTIGLHAISSLAYEADYFDLDSFLFLEKDPFEMLDEESGLIIKGFQQ